MTHPLALFNQLADAEEFFAFFELPYDASVVSVNRLHILRQFAHNLAALDPPLTPRDETEQFARYRDALQAAYQVFLTTTAQDQKLFSVFHREPGSRGCSTCGQASDPSTCAVSACGPP